MKILSRIAATLVVAALVLVVAVRVRFGGGLRLEDRTGEPELPASALELVADLDYPPGNIAVSAEGRVFFTLHPDSKPPVKVLELVDGDSVAYPSEAYQHPSEGIAYFQSILSLRVDRQDRLWVLDYANYGSGQPRITAFDLSTNSLVHHYDFTPDVAGRWSMLNDFQVSADGTRIYIAETSPLIHHPAIIVYDTVGRRARRVLDRHPSVMAEDYVIQAPGRDMIIYGIYTMRIGVDSIALDPQGQWLYYGPVSGGWLYRIATADLENAALSSDELGRRVERFAAKTLSDGLAMDLSGNIYLSDMEHSAVVVLGQDRRLRTLLRDTNLRWPDGFSFGPGGWLYVTCSALQHVLFISSEHMRENAPFQIFRFQPGVPGIPGH